MSVSCNDCKNCVLVDEGYSNYTVEGTTFYCLEKHHPETPFDNWYGGDKRHEYANECPYFEVGKGYEIDVEGEAYDDLSPDIVEKIKALQS